MMDRRARPDPVSAVQCRESYSVYDILFNTYDGRQSQSECKFLLCEKRKLRKENRSAVEKFLSRHGGTSHAAGSKLVATASFLSPRLLKQWNPPPSPSAFGGRSGKLGACRSLPAEGR